MKKLILLFCIAAQNVQATLIAEAWEKSVAERYRHENKPQDAFRDYENNCPERVKQFYYQNHTKQTMEFVLGKRATYCPLKKATLSVWDVMAFLDTLIDESDPDLNIVQSYHAYQTAEALRRDGHPRWLILVGFLHDLGKYLGRFNEPQWATVGDTFPLGCAYAKELVFSDYFKDNPDIHNTLYGTKLGIYEPGCGLDNVIMSWGHDEYLYQVMKDYLPEPALFIIRYHSFYALHREGAYQYLLDEHDKEMVHWLKLFSQYDLYSKDPSGGLDVAALKPYYQDLVAEFLPETLHW